MIACYYSACFTCESIRFSGGYRSLPYTFVDNDLHWKMQNIIIINIILRFYTSCRPLRRRLGRGRGRTRRAAEGMGLPQG